MWRRDQETQSQRGRCDTTSQGQSDKRRNVGPPQSSTAGFDDERGQSQRMPEASRNWTREWIFPKTHQKEYSPANTAFSPARPTADF